jgi:hypothetical protein
MSMGYGRARFLDLRMLVCGMTNQEANLTPVTNVVGYQILSHFQAGEGSNLQTVTPIGDCRFCGESDRRQFRMQAHLIPEGLGNRWLLSEDECDKCNNNFSAYESSLCSSVGPILTLGGTKGKKGKVRQSGRSRGSLNIRHTKNGGARRVSVNLLDIDCDVEPPQGTEITFYNDHYTRFGFPTPAENFIPRHAYKALVKIGLQIMPAEELENFRNLVNWLNSKSETEQFQFLDVGVSVGSLGNSPSYASATLLRRRAPESRGPYMILILTAGSICWQLDLMPDILDDHCGPARFGAINVNWSTVLSSPGCEPIIIAYDKPMHFDWSSTIALPIPIERIEYGFNYHTNQAELEVRWRAMAPQS